MAPKQRHDWINVSRTLRMVRRITVRCCLVLACSGCGPSYQSSVRGQATFDGQPLDRGTVLFHPDDKSGASAYGNIGTNGQFIMKIGKGDENRDDAGGIQPGSYTVTVSAREDSTPNADGGPPMPGGLITPAMYASVETTPIKVNIHAGDNEVSLALESPASPNPPLSADADDAAPADGGEATTESSGDPSTDETPGAGANSEDDQDSTNNSAGGGI